MQVYYLQLILLSVYVTSSIANQPQLSKYFTVPLTKKYLHLSYILYFVFNHSSNLWWCCQSSKLYWAIWTSHSNYSFNLHRTSSKNRIIKVVNHLVRIDRVEEIWQGNIGELFIIQRHISCFKCIDGIYIKIKGRVMELFNQVDCIINMFLRTKKRILQVCLHSS